MALNDTLLKTQMIIPMTPFIGPDSDKIWGAYAKGVIDGILRGSVVAVLDDKSNGAILPGGYSIDGSLIEELIIDELERIGQIITSKQEEIAGAIGASTQQIMSLATTTILGTQGAGAIHGGSATMLPLVITNFIGIIPGSEGLPTPLQLQFFLAISQIANHTLALTQISTKPGPGAVDGVIS